MTSQYFFRFGSEKSNMFHKFYQIRNRQVVYRQGYEKHLEKGYVLAFYYDDFQSEDVVAHFEGTKRDPRIKGAGYTTAKAFITAHPGDVFWIFLDDQILAFRYKEGELFDADEFNDGGCPAKCRYFDFVAIYDKHDLPDLFSTTDSCILSTIQNLHTADKLENKKVAEILLTLGKDKISVSNPVDALRYLSPTQLETVFFVLLHDNGCVVSSHRGGSKARIDLEILNSIKNMIPLFSKGARIQVKRTAPSKVAQAYLDDGIYFVTVDQELDKRFHGHPYFIGISRLKDFFTKEKTMSKSALNWMKCNLRSKYFEFAF